MEIMAREDKGSMKTLCAVEGAIQNSVVKVVLAPNGLGWLQSRLFFVSAPSKKKKKKGQKGMG